MTNEKQAKKKPSNNSKPSKPPSPPKPQRDNPVDDFLELHALQHILLLDPNPLYLKAIRDEMGRAFRLRDWSRKAIDDMSVVLSYQKQVRDFIVDYCSRILNAPKNTKFWQEQSRLAKTLMIYIQTTSTEIEEVKYDG